MPINKPILTALVLLAGLGLAGCKPLQAVNEVSSQASANLQDFDAFNTSLTDIYLDDCRILAYKDYSDSSVGLKIDTLTSSALFPFSFSVAKQKDTLLRRIYTALHGYFAALAKLSADSLVDYSLDTVSTSLSSGAILDTTKISPGTIGAVSAIAGKLGEFISNSYRLRHIKQYVVESDPFVQRLIKDMKSSLVDVRNFLSLEQRYLKDHVYDSLVKYSRSRFERKQALDEYFRVTEDIDNRERRLDSYRLSLDVIAAGHAYILSHVDDLRSKEVKKKLTGFASALKDHQSEFNALTQRSSK